MIGSVGRSQFRSLKGFEKRTMCLPVALALLFSAFGGHLCHSALERAYELIPIRDGKDLTRGNKEVLVTAPTGWEAPKDWKANRQPSPRPVWLEPRDIDYAIGFGLSGKRGDPLLSVWANHRGRANTEKVSPRNSYMGVNLETDITELKHVESFDAGVNGTLDVWQFRTYNRNYLLVLIVQPDNEGRTEVDVYLSSKDVDQLMPHLHSLKEVARSLRFVDR
jgi:hypothetical protein